MAVDFTERTGRTWSLGVNSGSAVRVLEIAGSDIEALYAELLGFEEEPNVGFTIKDPKQHPDFTWLRVDNIQIAPTQPEDPPKEGENNEYKRVLATVSYTAVFLPTPPTGGGTRPPEPTPEAGTYIEHTHEFSADIMTLPGHAFKWLVDNKQVAADIDVGKVIGMTTHTIKWTNVTSPPWDAIREKRAKVNDAEWLDMATESVMFMGATAEATHDAQGRERWNLSYVFMERTIDVQGADGSPYGWNHFYRAGKNPEWQKMIHVAGGILRFVYESTTFDDLFVQV